MGESEQVSRPEVFGSGREVPIGGLALEDSELGLHPGTGRGRGLAFCQRGRLGCIG